MSYRVMDLIEGAKNYVVNYGSVKKGEEVLVLTDPRVDPLVADAFAAAARDVGAKVTILTMGSMDLELPRYVEQDIPKTVKAAVCGADVLISATAYLIHPNDRWLNIPMMETGLRIIYPMFPSVYHLASEFSRFPAEILYAMALRDYEIVRKGTKLRITDPKGTDIVATISNTPDDFLAAGSGFNQRFGYQNRGTFVVPGTIVGGRFWSDINGVVYFDLIELVAKSPNKAPKWKVSNGYVEQVEGPGTELWTKMIKEDKKAALFSEIMWAYNPKMDLAEVWPENEPVTRCGGVLHMAMGQPASRAHGKVEKASTHKHVHTHGVLVMPTVTVDDKYTIIMEGHITALDDPKIREIAAKYGDPDKILAEVPVRRDFLSSI
jgi:leucyl aminopeptidase (aminopeptidase T)